jgi:hypothetical protein
MQNKTSCFWHAKQRNRMTFKARQCKIGLARFNMQNNTSTVGCEMQIKKNRIWHAKQVNEKEGQQDPACKTRNWHTNVRSAGSVIQSKIIKI